MILKCLLQTWGMLPTSEETSMWKGFNPLDSTPWILGHELTATLNPALHKTYSQTFLLYDYYRDAVISQPWELMAKLPPAPVDNFGADCSILLPLILCPSILQLLVSGFLTSALWNKMCCTVPFSQTLLHPPWNNTASKMRGFHLSSIYCSHFVIHQMLQHWCFPTTTLIFNIFSYFMRSKDKPPVCKYSPLHTTHITWLPCAFISRSQHVHAL